jgi:hypothetical protein
MASPTIPLTLDEHFQNLFFHEPYTPYPLLDATIQMAGWTALIVAIGLVSHLTEGLSISSPFGPVEVNFLILLGVLFSMTQILIWMLVDTAFHMLCFFCSTPLRAVVSGIIVGALLWAWSYQPAPLLRDLPSSAAHSVPALPSPTETPRGPYARCA